MKLLIAEDDLTSRTILTAVACKWGYEPIAVEDGEAAWEVLQENDAPRLLLIDREMPRLDGLGLCRRIREQQSDDPPFIILLTAHNSTADLVAGLKEGANDYIKKPFDNAELEARLQVGERMLNLQVELANTRDVLSEQKFALDQHAMVVITDVQGAITFANEKFTVASGYSHGELMGQNHRLLNSGTHDNAFFQNLYLTITNGEVWNGEICNRAKDDRLYWLDSTIVPFKGSANEPCSFIAIHTDITERKRAEVMKNEFVSTVSHELRTPLTVISGSLGLIAGGALGEMPTQAQQMIDMAHKNSQVLTYLINDLLNMDKLLAGEMHFDMQPESIMPLIEQALETNRAYGVERRVSFVMTHKVPDAEVLVDKQRLMQVLANLLSNAVKYSPQDGTVEVAVTSENNIARVTVTDHGPGIPDSFHSRIFQKFAQADSSDTRQKGGTGLGLAISKELVTKMGGQIGFDSEEGKGASFFIELPLIVSEETNTCMESDAIPET